MQIVQPSHSLLHPSAYLFLVAYIANIVDPDQIVRFPIEQPNKGS